MARCIENSPSCRDVPDDDAARVEGTRRGHSTKRPNQSNHFWGDDEASLLDGRNRLAAMELVGMPVIGDDGHLDRDIPMRRLSSGANPIPDPYDYVVSANIHRRHLSLAERQELIAKCLQRNPERSDRATAMMLKTDHKKVGAVRKSLAEAGRLEPTTETVGADGRVRRTATEKQVTRAVEASREAAKRQFDAAAAKLGMAPEPQPPAPAGEQNHKDARIAELEIENRELRARVEQAEAAIAKGYDQSHCSYCGKPNDPDAGWLLLIGNEAGICEACVERCARTIAEKRQPQVTPEPPLITEPEASKPRHPRTKALDDPTRPRNRGKISTGFGARVKEARQARGWSQERLAKTTGLGQASISRIEGNDPRATPAQCEQVAVTLGIELAAIGSNRAA